MSLANLARVSEVALTTANGMSKLNEAARNVVTVGSFDARVGGGDGGRGGKAGLGGAGGDDEEDSSEEEEDVKLPAAWDDVRAKDWGGGPTPPGGFLGGLGGLSVTGECWWEASKKPAYADKMNKQHHSRT
eukprot:CAMPEP_0202917578 /NCGR_PEP_ID=MMETSP1392-20130828/71316_1 /ASSEMBLY_ACC=CAM_ASM_000868 /TAXON_ID=225041 /ORGANISM="Chlamydomonas chlamydogama, Strain SAG 11-48b" /LENGTH=130 /DNA_ID=CAMNT_0049610365 /DNA_START=213 /DNA_END=605 /DNA_ORIENTATION=+